MSTEFSPCPFCAEEMTKAHAPDCYFEVKNSRDHAQVVKAWNRRASPAAAVPEGALPPLPWGDIKAVQGERLSIRIGDLEGAMLEYGRECARAAVEADRARQHQSGHMPPFAAPAGQLDEIIVEAVARGWGAPENAYKVMDTDLALAITREVYAVFAPRCRAEGGDGAVINYGDPVDNSADRAQQGEPVDERARFETWAVTEGAWAGAPFGRFSNDEYRHPGIQNDWKVWQGCARAAIKAAAPADAPALNQPVTQLELVMLSLMDAREVAMRNTAAARIPECGEFGRIAQNLDYAITAMESAEAARRAAPAPDTGIPTAGEVSIDTPPFRELLDEFAYRASERRAMGGDFGSAGAEEKAEAALISYIDRCRAPVSSTPTSGAVEKAGWKWVPVEPTDEMREACRVLNYCDDIDAEWARMIAAAPSHPSEAPTCTCPSGDGSLRWPCPVHPSEAKAGEDA